MSTTSRTLAGPPKPCSIEYPIAIDNEFEIWGAFDNHYWPALYLLDSDGQLRHHHFGEGEYGRMEIMIQQLLAEAGINDFNQDLVSVDARGAEAAADWDSLKSAENYLGYDRTENFASPGGAMLGERRVYDVPDRLKLNHWALSGNWTVENRGTVAESAERADSVPLSCPRSSSGHGTSHPRNFATMSRAHRWAASRFRPRRRH